MKYDGEFIKFNKQITVALISLTYFDASSFFDYLFIHYSRKLGKMEGDSLLESLYPFMPKGKKANAASVVIELTTLIFDHEIKYQMHHLVTCSYKISY